MPQPPSRRDIAGPPPRDVSDLATLVRHHGSYLRQLDSGMLGGRWATLRPVKPGVSQLVGSGDGVGDSTNYEWEYDDRGTAVGSGTQRFRLTYEPVDESLFVRWHPKGTGDLPLTSEKFTVDGQLVTIVDPLGIFAAGDVFSFQYQYEIGDDVPTPALIGTTAPGAVTGAPDTLTYALPVGTVVGSALVLTVRGQVAPGGGEVTDGLVCSDPRMTLVYTATGMNSGHLVEERIWVGFEDGRGTPIVVNVIQNPSYLHTAGWGVLASFSGINGFGAASANEASSATPVVDGVASVAVVWIRGAGVVVNAAPPSGYTDVGSAGSFYASTDISLWYDPDGSSSPSGTFTGEGCCVIPVT